MVAPAVVVAAVVPVPTVVASPPAPIIAVVTPIIIAVAIIVALAIIASAVNTDIHADGWAMVVLRVRGRRRQKRTRSQCAGDQYCFEHVLHGLLHVPCAVFQWNPAT